jgi:hypothetical protein
VSRLHTLSVFLLATALASPGMAHVVTASDAFSGYATGSLTGANGGSGWSGAWTGSSVAAVNGGQLDIFGNNDNAATRQLAQTYSGNVLISFDLRLSAGSLQGNDFLALWLGNSLGPNIGLKANCGGTAGCTNDLFARTNGVDAGGHAQDVSKDVTYSVLGYLQKTGGSAMYNRFDLWVDPTQQELASLTNADAFDLGNAGIGSFNRLGFRSANLDAGDVLSIDNLRVSYVPEPGSLALLGLGMAAVMTAARRRQR